MLASSSTVTGTEFTVSGVVILITMTCNNTQVTEMNSSFALRFHRSRNYTVIPPVRTLQPSSFWMGEGREVASFPEGNAVDYKNTANHFMLISRPSGRNFDLYLTFLDTEEDEDYFRIFRIEDNAMRTTFSYYAE